MERCRIAGSDREREDQALQHDIVASTLRSFERLWFRGRICVGVHKGEIIIYSKIETFDDETKNRIGRVLADTREFLEWFVRKYPNFCQTVAISYFPDDVRVH